MSQLGLGKDRTTRVEALRNIVIVGAQQGKEAASPVRLPDRVRVGVGSYTEVNTFEPFISGRS